MRIAVRRTVSRGTERATTGSHAIASLALAGYQHGRGSLPAQSRLSQLGTTMASLQGLYFPRWMMREWGKGRGTPCLQEYTAATGHVPIQVPQTHKAYRAFPRYTGVPFPFPRFYADVLHFSKMVGGWGYGS